MKGNPINSVDIKGMQGFERVRNFYGDDRPNNDGIEVSSGGDEGYVSDNNERNNRNTRTTEDLRRYELLPGGMRANAIVYNVDENSNVISIAGAGSYRNAYYRINDNGTLYGRSDGTSSIYRVPASETQNITNIRRDKYFNGAKVAHYDAEAVAMQDFREMGVFNYDEKQVLLLNVGSTPCNTCSGFPPVVSDTRNARYQNNLNRVANDYPQMSFALNANNVYYSRRESAYQFEGLAQFINQNENRIVNPVNDNNNNLTSFRFDNPLGFLDRMEARARPGDTRTIDGIAQFRRNFNPTQRGRAANDNQQRTRTRARQSNRNGTRG